MDARTFNEFMYHAIASTTTDITATLTFNNDTGTNYAQRRSKDGGADSTLTSTASISAAQSASNSQFLVMYVINILAEEKLIITFALKNGTAGAATAPQRQEGAFKWSNTSNQITEIDFTQDTASVDYDTGSNLSALGTD